MTTRVIKTVGLLAMMVAGGCSTVASGDSDSMPVGGETAPTCKAEAAQTLVGRVASEALAAEAMRLTGAGTLRWIPHDGVVTMDLREDRLNIELDPANKVTGIRCG
ncbi:I78 family peptidase inhibitor [Allosphingosinicella deserti]|uniref:Peptidase inhibitor I78 n=1 Tax=Allosphingosinicella deserti TaxID=2116704 RepID=A0A2P7QH50_9SPHN|nr:I78 family peptidase inhibitor [Sphingomonas deserti]PSJ37289.1 peptidase inhibitor I78 [Sphingomonas deserti]